MSDADQRIRHGRYTLAEVEDGLLDRTILRLSPNPTSPINEASLAGYPQVKREKLISKLARANEYKSPESCISRKKMLSALMALTEEPIERLEFLPTSAGIADLVFPALIERVAKKSSRSLASMHVNVASISFWIRHEVPLALRFKNLRELRIPCFAIRSEDLDKITRDFPKLVVLDCLLHPSLTKETVASMLKRLGRLKKFFFDLIMEGEHVQNVDSRCECYLYSRYLVQQCPHLTTVGSEADFADAHTSGFDLEFEIRVCHALDDAEAESLTGASSLQYLVIFERSMHPRQAEWHSESAKSLCVVGLSAENNWETLNRLRAVEFLYTVNCRPSGPIRNRIESRTFLILNDVVMYQLRQDCSPNTELFMTTQPLPAVLNAIKELHFHYLDENWDRLVDVMTTPTLEEVHITFQNLDKSSLERATEILRLKDDVGLKLNTLTLAIRGKIKMDNQKVLIEFCQVICKKANLKNFPSCG